MIDIPAFCIHSKTYADCASCWHRNYQGMVRQEARLRDLIEMFGDEFMQLALVGHDKFWLGGNAPERTRARYDEVPEVRIPHDPWEQYLEELDQRLQG